MLKFDPEKLKTNEKSTTAGTFLSIHYSFSVPSVSASGTQVELSENIRRIGGFDTEIVDKDTFKLISKL